MNCIFDARRGLVNTLEVATCELLVEAERSGCRITNSGVRENQT